MIITEGETQIDIPSIIDAEKKGPLTKIPGFYNPNLEFDRDITILFLQNLKNEGYTRFLDGLSATGIRGIRMAKEVGGEIYINEWNEKSNEIIKKNISINETDVNVTKKDLRVLLLEKRNYDFIDIDPYGSPASFVDSAFQGAKKDCFIAFTSTDKATLCGVYPSVCKRRYDAVPSHGDSMKEIGLRILIGFFARQAVRYNHSITPLLSYSKDHYYRVYLKMGKGVKKAHKTLDAIGWISKEKGEWKICKNTPGIGPLWLEKIHDKIIIGKLYQLLKTKTLGKRWDITKFFHLIDKEADAPAFYYETDKIASRLKKSQPKIIEVIKHLKNNGFYATRTHFEQSGIKTEASLEKIENIFYKC